jgi:hypothetical protein
MACGKNKGRFREIRVGRFGSNMGALASGVKSTDVEEVPNGCGSGTLLKLSLMQKVVKYSR